MGSRGPAPEPRALRILKGNPSKRPLNDQEPEPPPIAEEKLPPPPKYLDKEAKAEWIRIGPELAAMKLLSTADLVTLEGYCVAYSRALRADRHIKSKGLVIKTAWGPKINPAVSVARKEWEAVRRFASEFGFSPSSRTRIRVEKPKAKAKDSAEEFLFGRKRSS